MVTLVFSFNCDTFIVLFQTRICYWYWEVYKYIILAVTNFIVVYPVHRFCNCMHDPPIIQNLKSFKNYSSKMCIIWVWPWFMKFRNQWRHTFDILHLFLLWITFHFLALKALVMRKNPGKNLKNMKKINWLNYFFVY